MISMIKQFITDYNGEEIIITIERRKKKVTPEELSEIMWFCDDIEVEYVAEIVNNDDVEVEVVHIYDDINYDVQHYVDVIDRNGRGGICAQGFTGDYPEAIRVVEKILKAIDE